MMRVVWLFLVALISVSCCGVLCDNSNNEDDIVVTTDLGKIRGSTLTTMLGKNFYAFRGIRYAKPPVGELRFQAPRAVDPWDGVLDATEDGPMCPQPTSNLSDVSEDCLRLNVYARELPSDGNSTALRPVVIYIHPGGFYVLSGQSKNFAGPQVIMDRDIVFVTINYRLGALGFMSTGTADAPGNAGLKDQVVAFKWVKDHIHKFGGDPQSVTVMGYSAGSFSITLHLVSPMSRGLFHKAIAMSASGVSQWVVPPHQLHLAKRQARLLNCTDEDVSEMVACLKTRNAVDFGTSLPGMFEFGTENPMLLWSPVVEMAFGQERFLTEDPVRLYQKGALMKIPILAGISRDEFVFPAINILKDVSLLIKMEWYWKELAPICFLYERETLWSKRISAILRKFYLDDKSLTLNGTLEGLAHLYADALVGFGMNRFVNLAARHTTVYQYRFSYQGRWSHTYYPDDKPYGVVHHDELIYFLNGRVYPGIPEYLTVERMTRMWTNFARTGNPNNSSDDYLKDLDWMPFNLETKEFLEIGNDLVMKDRMYASRYALWETLFPLTWNHTEQNVEYPNIELYLN